MSFTKVKLHRLISWLLAIFALFTIGTGYALSRGWLPQAYYIVSLVHRIFEIFFVGLFIIHVALTFKHYGINWSKALHGIREGKAKEINFFRVVQRISSWFIIVFAFLVILAGLNGLEFFATGNQGVIPFAWHRFFDLFLIIAIVVHVAIGIRFTMMRRRIRKDLANGIVISLTLSLLVVGFGLNITTVGNGDGRQNGEGTPDQSESTLSEVTIDETVYRFNSSRVETVRPDIFLPGSFSMFDVLVHVAQEDGIDLEWRFNSSMNTHVINSLNGHEHWWYRAHYSGGWMENNVYRMDHYVYKEGTKLVLYKEDPDRIRRIYSSYVEEVDRHQGNNGQVIIPTVTIQSRTQDLTFYSVNVTPHDLRNETFRDGVITGIDVIMSLGDQGKLTYDIQWYDSIGTANIVRNYYIVRINEDQAAGTCGFVYDSGDQDFFGFQGNHIHLPSDVRVLNSPEYMRWFWICL
jgi:succinate dehydrogenase/fumarate reductase cytochrome b subunit